MACRVSWIPAAVATTLRDERSAQPVILWLTNIRDSIEEYDPLIAVRPPTPESDSNTSSATPDSAFDEILSQLGNEIFKLDEYQRNLIPDEKEVSLSILNIFDKCLEGMSEVAVEEKFEVVSERDLVKTNETPEVKCEQGNEVISDEKQEVVSDVIEAVNGVCGSDVESLSDLSFVTSTPKLESMNSFCEEHMNNNVVFNHGKAPPVPLRRTKFKTPSITSSTYDNIESRPDSNDKRSDSDHDSISTCWSYKECSNGDIEPPYSHIWYHSSGYKNSDEIIRQVLSQHHATISRISFDTASDFSPVEYSVYSLHQVDNTLEVHNTRERPVDNMTGLCEDGYEPVRDAITLNENIYEEIEYINSYTDEGCSCGSIEAESCSISASSEYVDRDSPVYVNLRDNSAYAIPSDVIFWKNLLLHPFYNDDEEDEWITPEECSLYSGDQRPPLVIPRITQYRPPPRRDARPMLPQVYLGDGQESVSLKSSVRHERLQDWSPTSERSQADLERSYSKASSDSPPFVRLNKRFGGSTENLLFNNRRPNHLQLPASSSGDSLLDIEVREKEPGYARNRKSRSMVAPKHRMRSPAPVPAPRMMLAATPEVCVLLEGPVKRTKFTENGKKCRKNWTECYMTLTPTALVFYKDQKTYYATKMPRPPGTPPSPTAPRVELILPLKNAHVQQCIHNHTRRYTRSIILTVGYDQYLVQDETEDGGKRWLTCIQNVVFKLGPINMNEYPTYYQSSNTDLESLGRTPPVSRHSNRSNQRGGSSNEDLSDSTEIAVPKPVVKKRLKYFFAIRATKESLVKRGIYQEEPVFGRKLEEVCPSTIPRVPEFVVQCIKEIESSEENMCTDGLYRASGNLSQVQKIRLEVDQNHMEVIVNSTDIHVLTGSLKLFFRELKEPLIPCELFDRVLAACSVKPKDAKIKEFRDIIHSLPQCNKDTLKYLLEHLLRVTQYSERNRMHTANLAIVFGPTLLWAPAEQAHNIAIDCIQQNHVVEILLNDFKEIFEDIKGKRKT